MAKIIVVTSGKGGVGKTTTSASFGAGLAERGYKTVIIDFDVGLRNVDLVMGSMILLMSSVVMPNSHKHWSRTNNKKICISCLHHRPVIKMLSRMKVWQRSSRNSPKNLALIISFATALLGLNVGHSLPCIMPMRL